MNSHIWCDNCDSIQPLIVDRLDGDDVTGKFTDADDLVCATCKLVISTTYAPKSPPRRNAGQAQRIDANTPTSRSMD